MGWWVFRDSVRILYIRSARWLLGTGYWLLLRNYFYSYAHGSCRYHVDFAGGGEREIDDPAFDEWSAIGDADVDAFSIREIGHLDPGIDGKGAMRGGQFLHVVHFSVRRASTIVGNSVPTGDAGFGFADGRGFHRRGNMRRSFSRAAGD